MLRLNDELVAVVDIDETTQLRPVSIDVFVNDVFPETEKATIVQLVQLSDRQGTMRIVGDSDSSVQLEFTPAAGFYGAARYAYRFEVRGFLSNGIVSRVDVANVPPVAVDDVVTLVPSTTSKTLDVALDLLANDSDAGLDALEVTSIATFPRAPTPCPKPHSPHSKSATPP